MTTNVVVATYHGVILGCDSLSSIIERAYFPFRVPNALARDERGEVMTDPQGRLLLAYDERNFQYTPTNIMGGVQKMFPLHEDVDPQNIECSVAATTSGLGSLNGVVIAEVAERFRRRCRTNEQGFNSIEQVVSMFLDYVRPQWEMQVGFDAADPAAHSFLDDLQFLIAGYGPADEYIKVIRVSVANESAVEVFKHAPHCSAAWAGQASAVASLLMGFNPTTRWAIDRAVVESLSAQRESVVTSVLGHLREQGVAIPEPFEARIDEVVPADLPWSEGSPEFDWANLPVQSAVDLVSTLVNAQSAMQKFAMGIPTVGGRTRIGLMRRGMPFAFLNEPEIVHQHVGYSHEA
ncbi:hypothetical protein ACIGHF_04180 [Stenotrophomonas sp. NPDC077464]|uniref:hypothetical protein n=1 Tax=unclassified Stenotrophomonas TaxID=196198 RepID=UPI0037D33DA2